MRLLPTLAAVLAVLLTARLGMWQLDRAAEKTAWLEAQRQAEAQAPLEPADLPPDLDGLRAGLRHRTAWVEGRWVPAATVFLDNRQMGGQPGFFVLTPLRLDDGSALVVQRGWAPRHRHDRSLIPSAPLAEGPVRLRVRVTGPPARLTSLGPDSPGPLRQNLDLAQHAAATGLALRPYSVLLLEAPPGPPDGLRRDWPRPSADVAKHQGYATQWFLLSLLFAGLYAWFQFLRPRRPGHA